MDEFNTYGKDLINLDWEGLLIKAGVTFLKIVVIILIYIMIKKLASAFITRLFLSFQEKNSISKGRAFTLESLTKNLVSYLLIFVLVVTILQTFGIQATAILAGAGIVGLAVGFGAQGLVSDVVTGFFLLLEKQLDVGDNVIVGNYSGTVEQVGLRTTQIRSGDGTLNYIPNREITTLSNQSRGDMQALVDVMISTENDIPQTLNVLQKVCDSIKKQNPLITDGPNVAGIQTLGTGTITIRIIAKTVNNEQVGIERLLRKEIKEELDRTNIKFAPSQLILAPK
ncbi:mechanosensitive ion channel family protein [Niallia sp. 03133]|uniref:mechanosensitive ion channel family protein n=1 Tax=Niallia sp. 03133 TaxID=3458060 RepID=UPI0040451286